MNHLVYPRERTLGAITLVLGLFFWLALILGTFGMALVALLIGFIAYLFAQSALIAHIRGNGVELSEYQFPELHAQFAECCDRLGLRNRPEAYILNGNGGLNAFATQFLGTQFVVLYSDVVDAMEQHADGVRFYIGHELGHLRMKHLSGHLLRWPALWVPLLAAAYARARESTCDRHGAACSSTPEGAARALAALAAGAQRWKALDVAHYVRQAGHTSGFWMSFHELTAGYPWITKRVARVADAEAQMPSRHPLAAFLALFVPYSGRAGGAFGLLLYVYIIGVLAAVALPAYQDYTVKAKLYSAYLDSAPARTAVGNYYLANQAIPASLGDAGANGVLRDGSTIEIDPQTMVLTLSQGRVGLVFVPSKNEQGQIVWKCEAGANARANQLPRECR